ncbi:MAG TPA: hypothetical protein PLC98_19305 [Anaerolineales bacterium]|nr:hypothetical protein [Anaerolineales bacterium]
MTTLENQDTVRCCPNQVGPASLRCYKCGKPICPKCAIRTPVGYSCRDCVRQHQKAFDTAEWFDYPVAAVISAIAGGLGGLVVSFVGFFVILIAPAVGAGTAEIVRFAVRKRRARYLGWAAGAGFAFGALALPACNLLISLFAGGSTGLGGLFLLIWPLIYVVLGTGALIGRLQGIVLGR